MNGTAMISVPADGRFTDEMAMRELDGDVEGLRSALAGIGGAA